MLLLRTARTASEQAPSQLPQCEPRPSCHSVNPGRPVRVATGTVTVSLARSLTVTVSLQGRTLLATLRTRRTRKNRCSGAFSARNEGPSSSGAKSRPQPWKRVPAAAASCRGDIGPVRTHVPRSAQPGPMSASARPPAGFRVRVDFRFGPGTGSGRLGPRRPGAGRGPVLHSSSISFLNQLSYNRTYSRALRRP